MASEAMFSGIRSSASLHSSQKAKPSDSSLLPLVASLLTLRRVSLNQPWRERTKSRWNFIRRQKLECKANTANSRLRVAYLCISNVGFAFVCLINKASHLLHVVILVK
ncbi:hypothetical protein Fot_12859 [Forsythia ovata]|uniref:Uncharacterized protein n=1 Tax=Forsythia ovata TaxID=205694 RepID=A0ABD1W1X9_9LAMI